MTLHQKICIPVELAAIKSDFILGLELIVEKFSELCLCFLDARTFLYLLVKFSVIAFRSCAWFQCWLRRAWGQSSNITATYFLHAVILLSRQYCRLVAILGLESGLGDEIDEGGLIQILNLQWCESLLEGVELHYNRAHDRAEIKLEFGGLLVHSHVDHFSHIYIDPPHQFILVGSALANEKQLDDRLPLQELQFAVIEEHFEL